MKCNYLQTTPLFPVLSPKHYFDEAVAFRGSCRNAVLMMIFLRLSCCWHIAEEFGLNGLEKINKYLQFQLLNDLHLNATLCCALVVKCVLAVQMSAQT